MNASEIIVDPPLNSELRQSIEALWTIVSANGGAVGFTSESTPETIARFAEAELAPVEVGRDHLIVATDGGEVVAMTILQGNPLDITAHWMEVKRFMVHPRLQKTGFGRQFADTVSTLGRDKFGLEQLYLTARSGLGTETFWTKCGYELVATLPKRVKVGPNDYRDVYCLVRHLG